jgi:ketosteroid isomerase-like protein
MNATETIIAMERAALDQWGVGDVSGFLEISAPDVVYFDPYIKRRLDGWVALAERYEAIRGNPQFDRYELIDPKVQVCGEAAVLTFNLVSYRGETVKRWNCTEVYRKAEIRWQIIQSHSSYTLASGI